MSHGDCSRKNSRCHVKIAISSGVTEAAADSGGSGGKLCRILNEVPTKISIGEIYEYIINISNIKI
jgi:hypothetical protein